MAKGPIVVGYGAGRIPTDGVNFDNLEAAAKEWFGHDFDVLGVSAFKDKLKMLRSSPHSPRSVGQPYYDGDDAARSRARRVIADSQIDCSIGPHWNGIVGKVNPNAGRFSVGSAKGYGSAAFNALTKTELRAHI